ncbi:MAG: GNAT family N-acetyltransferase, partial [Chloroflexota bacterium]
MEYVVQQAELDTIQEHWRALLARSAADCVFCTPEWLRVCRDELNRGDALHLLAVRRDSELVAVAPLALRGDTLIFWGDPNVCDYSDVVVARGHEAPVYAALAAHVDALPWRAMRLHGLRADSPALEGLTAAFGARGWLVERLPEDVAPRMDIPSDWESYVESLSRKDRHELRRKLRRLTSAGQVSLSANGGDLERDMQDLFQMMEVSRTDKAGFLTPERRRFFQVMAAAMRGAGFLRLFFMTLDGQRVSTALCFDYGDCYKLYNSGYDPAQAHLSVGLLVKALCVKDAI